jgi:hypothetical protein
MPVGSKRSSFFEFIALQRKVRFTDDPVFEKVGTGSGFGTKIKKPGPNPALCHDVTLLLRSLRATIQGKIFHSHFVRAEGPSARITRLLPSCRSSDQNASERRKALTGGTTWKEQLPSDEAEGYASALEDPSP